jgi:hypothetical protein
MPPRVSAIEAHPEFYADITAAGGLALALTRAAEGLDLQIGTPETVRDGSLSDVRIPAALPGRADFTVTARRYRRLFSVDNHECGIAHARGRTPDLGEVARAAAAWFAGADPRGMNSAAPFIELPLQAEARASGSAQAVVEANWQGKREAWGRRWEYRPDGWREPTAVTGLRALLDAACAQPRLRHLYAVTSHYILWFSRCTDHPYARVGAAIEPQNDGRYRVWRHRDESEYHDTAQAAVTRAADFLPHDCGTTILGTTDDVPD